MEYKMKFNTKKSYVPNSIGDKRLKIFIRTLRKPRVKYEISYSEDKPHEKSKHAFNYFTLSHGIPKKK